MSTQERRADGPWVVTGGNTGTGYATARALAGQGHAVIIACRSPAKGEAAARALREEAGPAGGSVEAVPLDLAELDAVRRCAALLAERHGRLAGLICNAGVMNPPYQRTVDGYELQFQANYLGHFLLSLALLPALLAGGRRLIQIASLSSERGALDRAADFLALGRCAEADYVPIRSYREAKLAQVLLAYEAHRRYGAEGLVASAVHPGVVNTDLFYRTMPGWARAVLQPVARLGYLTGRLRTPEQGAATAIYLATSEVAGGQYWADRAPRAPNPRAHDAALGRELWELSAAAVGLGAAALA